MPSVRSIALSTVAVLATAAQAEHLRVVWSSGSFSTVGGESGGYKGFAILNDAGEAIYDQSTPNDHSPCYNTDGGRTFTIDGDCWDTPREFHCESSFGGLPESCSVADGDGNVLGEGTGQKDTEFIGISIGQDSTCVVEFDSDGGGCPVDDGNGPLHASGN